MNLLRSVMYPGEIFALLRCNLGGSKVVMRKINLDTMRPSLRKCYQYLKQTSVTYGPIIQSMDDQARDSMCIYYLLVRALDTVEDDMTIPKDMKIPMLKSFYENLDNPTWSYMNSKNVDRVVLEDFPMICNEYQQLPENSQKAISNNLQELGFGMAVFLDRKIETLEEFDEYCHYVSSLVGIGFYQLAVASGLEEVLKEPDLELAEKLGFFLHRHHVIRDFYEDIQEGREYWPKEISRKYAEELKDFLNPSKQQAGVECVNEMVTHALEPFPGSIHHISRLQSKSLFRLFGVPLVMATATLERSYNNPSVFADKVKIRKGEAAKMLMDCNSIEDVKSMTRYYINKILTRIPSSDPNCDRTKEMCLRALETCQIKQS